MSRRGTIILLVAVLVGLGWWLAYQQIGFGPSFVSGLARYARQRLTGQTPQPQVVEPSPAQPTFAGFETTTFVEGLTKPTRLAVHPLTGELFVSELGGTIYRIDQAAGKHAVASGFRQLLGIAFEPERLLDEGASVLLLVASRGTVSRLTEQPDRTFGHRRDLVTGLPAGRHQTDLALLGPDGKLYIATGSRSDRGEGGIHPHESTILLAEPDGQNLRVFAQGLRNPFGMTFHPTTGELFVSDNGQDVPASGVPDELNVVTEGGDYGWPTCWGRGGGACAGKMLPIAELQEHSSADGFAFYTGTTFPEEYQGNIFIALWGANSRDPGIGKKVQRIVLTGQGQNRTASVTDFLTGLENPIDVKVGPDGNLYVLDFGKGQLLRVSPVYRTP